MPLKLRAFPDFAVSRIEARPESEPKAAASSPAAHALVKVGTGHEAISRHRWSGEFEDTQLDDASVEGPLR